MRVLLKTNTPINISKNSTCEYQIENFKLSGPELRYSSFKFWIDKTR